MRRYRKRKSQALSVGYEKARNEKIGKGRAEEFDEKHCIQGKVKSSAVKKIYNEQIIIMRA